METVINIYIVRHGQSLMNEQKLIQGQKEFSNNGLSKEGIKQIKGISQYIKKLDINKIFSSDLQRCKESAELINKDIKVDVEYVKNLREQDCEDWEGLKSSEIKKHPTKEIIPHHGESMKDVEKRVIPFIKSLMKENESNILLLTHAAVIQNIIGYFLDIPYSSRLKIKLKGGCLSHISIDKEYVKVVMIGFVDRI